MPLRIPDLQERPKDILLLAHNFLQEESRKLQRGKISFSPTALPALTVYTWPGNVRELQNRIRRALGTAVDNVISAADLGMEELPVAEQKLPTLKEARDMVEKNVIHQALALTGNNISLAAKLLDISHPALHDLLKKHWVSAL